MSHKITEVIGTNTPAEICLPSANTARISRTARCEFGKFLRIQDAGENLKAIDNPRSRAGEVRTRVHQIDFASARSGKQIEFRKAPKNPSAAAISVACGESETLRFTI
jgi:hypothetical protein